MYGCLNFDVKNLDNPWIAHHFSLPGVADTLKPEQARARRLGVEYLVKSVCTEPTDADRMALSHCRMPGQTGPPRMEDGFHPRMNARDWRDTRSPCLVPHVQPAN